jgi:glycosyltransferase involved in cell wall biosynthesis
MTVTISIVIPVYNGAAFIADTVQACLKQTYRDFEVVVVNDGSRDATLEQLAPFGDAIRIISIPNGGVSNARNVGVQASVGAYVAFLDADDIWQADKLERHLGAMLAHPTVGFSCSNYRTISPGWPDSVHFDQYRDNPGMWFDRPMPATQAYRQLIHGNFVGTCSNVIARRDLLVDAGLFNVGLRQAEDYDLWLRCAERTDFLLLSDVLLDKVGHDSNLTNNLVETWQYHEQVLVALRDSEAVLVRGLRDEVRRELSTVRYIIGNRLFNRGQARAAFTYFGAALGSHLSLANFFAFSGHATRKATRLLLETLKLRAPFRDY